MRIIKGKYIPIPRTYSQDMHLLVSKLLLTDYTKRPSVAQVLEFDFVKAHAKNIGIHIPTTNQVKEMIETKREEFLKTFQ